VKEQKDPNLQLQKVQSKKIKQATKLYKLWIAEEERMSREKAREKRERERSGKAEKVW
jgi:hypothetical protein